jgi:hypothetical protein
MDRHPTSLQLRYLQTLIELASERTSTLVFPVPIDTIAPFLEQFRRADGRASLESEEELAAQH